MVTGHFRVAVVQLRVDAAESVSDRRDRVEGLVADLGGRADLVVLPELWESGAFATEASLQAARSLEKVLPAWGSLARRSGVALHAGSFPESDAGPGGSPRPRNTSVVVGSDGHLQATYRKIHLFGFDRGEATDFHHGTEPVVWRSPWGPLGLATCYDLRFPELFRALTERGALGFLLPSGWPSARISHWQVLARARAIENQAFVIASNCVGTHNGVTMGGRSLVVDPHGDVLAEGGPDTEETLMVDVDLGIATAWRAEFPALKDRRL